MRISLILLLLPALFTSCSKEDSTQSSGIVASTMLNQSYGTDSYQDMDIYLPANRNVSTTKVIILIHGGGWTSGDKSASTPFVDTLKRRLPDYAIFNINYRLSTGAANLFPTQEMDVKLAVDYIYAHRSQYLISDKIVLSGESAGGHLAMLQAYKYNIPVKIKAVVSFFGPSDLADMYNNPVNGNTLISTILAQTIGATPATDPDIYYSSSPVNFITASSGIPTILFHGSSDPLVAPVQSTTVRDKLQLLGIPTEFTLYPGLGHGTDWGPTTFADAFSKIEIFLNTYVQ